MCARAATSDIHFNKNMFSFPTLTASATIFRWKEKSVMCGMNVSRNNWHLSVKRKWYLCRCCFWHIPPCVGLQTTVWPAHEMGFCMCVLLFILHRGSRAMFIVRIYRANTCWIRQMACWHVERCNFVCILSPYRTDTWLIEYELESERERGMRKNMMAGTRRVCCLQSSRRFSSMFLSSANDLLRATRGFYFAWFF